VLQFDNESGKRVTPGPLTVDEQGNLYVVVGNLAGPRFLGKVPENACVNYCELEEFTPGSSQPKKLARIVGLVVGMAYGV